MRDILIKKAKEIEGREERYNFIREFVQELILKIMDDSKKFSSWCFVGGTALHILYDMNRFSEDLDFVNIREKISEELFLEQIDDIKKVLLDYHFVCNTKSTPVGSVKNTFFKISEILFETKVTHRKEQNLSIKVDIDTNPPEGGGYIISPVNKQFFFKICHHDLPSFFSGKLHTILCRAYTKGRDFYDLVWLLTKKNKVNKLLLENAYFQTQKKKMLFDKENLINLLAERIAKVDFREVHNDLSQFLVDKSELELINKELILKEINNIEIQ